MAIFGSKSNKKPDPPKDEFKAPQNPAASPATWQPKSDPVEPAQPSAPVPPEPAESSREFMEKKGVITIIGQEITIKGELLGDGDVTLEGRVEGKITLKKNLVVGEKGYVEADIEAATVTISGKVYGNVFAKSKVEIVATGFLEGNIHAPKIVIAEGAHFKGSVDMSEGVKKAETPAPAAPSKPAGQKPETKPSQAAFKPANQEKSSQ